jgi:hypothetical protein
MVRILSLMMITQKRRFWWAQVYGINGEGSLHVEELEESPSSWAKATFEAMSLAHGRLLGRLREHGGQGTNLVRVISCFIFFLGSFRLTFDPTLGTRKLEGVDSVFCNAVVSNL